MGSSNGEGRVKRVAYIGRMLRLVKRRETLDETKGLVMDENWGWEKGWGWEEVEEVRHVTYFIY